MYIHGSRPNPSISNKCAIFGPFSKDRFTEEVYLQRWVISDGTP
jgi:hypothetical protein